MNVATYTQRHHELIDQLDAYIDHELGDEKSARVEAHLSGCTRCQRALQLHRALRDTLAGAPVARAPDSLRERLLIELDAEQAPPPRGASATHQRPRVRQFAQPWLGWAAAAGLAAVMLVHGFWTGPQPSQQIPMVEAALADYQLHFNRELPAAGPQQLAAIERTVAFKVQPMPALRHQLIGAWQTRIRGEPAVALAYRYGNHVLVQYVVSQSLFFRQPRVREAVARDGRYSTTSHGTSVLAWAQSDSGSLLIGAVDLQQLEALRT